VERIERGVERERARGDTKTKKQNKNLRAQEHASEVDIDDGLPVLELHAEDQGIPGDARVVDQARDGLIEALLDSLEHGRHLVGVRGVGLHPLPVFG